MLTYRVIKKNIHQTIPMSGKAKEPKLFYLLLVAFPVVLLILLEIVLRLFSFGYDYPLFIESNTLSGYLQPNPNIVKRFFNDPKQAPKIAPDTFYFKKKKATDSFRIVIQGGSTAAGFPFGRFGSLHGMLQQRFKRLYPNKEIEIISTAMSAINSYAMLDFTDEILAVKPDLILIYAGHNEFVGIMGAGSAYASQGNRTATLLFLKLKNLKVFQLVQSVVSLFNNEKRTNVQATDNRTLMAKVAKSKHIILNSALFQRGVEQFSLNLDIILSKYKSAGIPVLISTLVSNEMDQRPFASGVGGSGADAYFKRAQQFVKQNKYDKAKDAFIEAKDRDQLRFRAPSIFNKVIREKVDKDRVELVDTEGIMRAEANNHIIGFQHMFEHLHPNARGYFLMAKAFSDKIVSQNYISKTVNYLPNELAWRDVPITKVDLIAAKFKIKTLTSDYPFRKDKITADFGTVNSFEKKMAKKKLSTHDWLDLHQQMLKHYQQSNQGDKLSNLQEAAKVAGLIFDAFPNQAQAAWVAGQIYFSINDTKIAEYYLNRSVKLQPKNVEHLMSYAYALYVNKNKKSSLEVLKRVLAINPAHSQALRQTEKLLRN